MSKRKVEEFDLEDLDATEVQRPKFEERAEKHTLDSDEEDSADEERYNVMNEEEIEGEEDGVSGMEGDVKITPFNMKEELEEGHFDREGHFHWDKSKEIKDNWLDNIDWVKVKTDKKYIEKTNRGLADSSDSEEEEDKQFNQIETYKEILKLMQPKETINKALQRLGKNTAKLSSAERWRRKKAGIVCENAEVITKLTALTNDILTKLGNMDVYDETYEQIERKIKQHDSKQCKAADLDMYADDFDGKEKSKLDSIKGPQVEFKEPEKPEEPDQKDSEEKSNVVQWEFKWKQDDTEVYGPYSTEQMQNWVEEGYFTSGVFVRKVGEDTRFYTSNRIDFELYL